MNLGEIVSLVVSPRYIDDEDHNIYSEATVKAAINEAISKLVNLLLSWGFWDKITSVAVATTGGTQEYDLPADFKHAVRVSIESELIELQYSHQYHPGFSADEQGTPLEYYLIEGYEKISTNTRYPQIGFYPTPDSAYSVTVVYEATTAELSADADIPVIPVSYHYMIAREAAIILIPAQDLRNAWKAEQAEEYEIMRTNISKAPRFQGRPFKNVFTG